MGDLATLVGAGLRTLDASALAKIDAGMVEQRRIAAIWGRSNSQTSAKLMSVTMLAAAPYRHLRQIAAEIEKRVMALQEAAIKLKRSQMEAAIARNDAERLDGHAKALRLLDAEQLDHGIVASQSYVEGALKDVACLQDAYEQIRTSHGIRDTWDEADFESGEIEHHLRSVFRLAYRDMLSTGRVGHAACEYAEQFGVHPQVLHARTAEYVASCEALLAGGSAPTGDHLQDWLDACCRAHRDDPRRAAARLGLVDLITRWSLYLDPERPC